MQPVRLRPAIALALLFLLTGPAPAAPPGFKALAIGDPAPDFKLPGVDGKTHALTDFADARVLVVVFTCNHCPTANAYDDRVRKLHADYKAKGVALVAISPNDPLAVRLDELGYTDVGGFTSASSTRPLYRSFRSRSKMNTWGVASTP